MTSASGRGFTLLWVSQAFSQLGTSISSLAYPLLVLDLTGSATDAGLVATVVAATALVVRIPGGALADRFPHRTLMLLSDAARALVVGTVTVSVLTGAASVPLLLVAVMLEVLCGAAFGPAEFALVRRIVAPENRALAVGRMQSRVQLAGLLGPIAGGALYGIAPALPFLADAVSYAASFLLVAAVRVKRSAPPTGRTVLTEGWRWLRRHPFLFPAGLWLAALTAVFAAVGLAILVLARDRGASATEIGFMYGISTAGGLLGALATPALQTRMPPRTILRAAAVVDTFATLVLLPLESPYAIGVAGAAAFFLAPAASASLFGELSRVCPDDLVGRAQASLGLVVGSVAPLAPVAVGAVLDGAGPFGGILACAAAFAVLALAAFVLPAFRRPG